MKDKDSGSWHVSFLDQLDLAMTKNVILDDLHDRKNECYIWYFNFMGWEVFIYREMEIICGHNFQFWPTKL